MCGISGIYSFGNKSVDQNRLAVMTDVLHHRGPDDKGHWVSSNGFVGLGHNRLSIIDLSQKGHQPMTYLDRFTITFNGEIYNYPELKSELEGLGFRFTSQSDTEVLLAAYAHYGEDCVYKLDGMFSFAIYDQKERSLFCARDRFGEKPFYYSNNGEELIFASEIKAIRQHVATEIETTMLYYYLQYDVVSDPFHPEKTFYRNILSLPPSHRMTFHPDGTSKVKQYWQLESKENNWSDKEAIEQFRSLFSTSIKRRLRSDVEVGSSLSGGLDSSSVVAMINREKQQAQHTFSARFNDPDKDEGVYIKMVNDRFNLISHEVYPDPGRLSDDLTKLFYHQEEPFGSASIFAQWEVMKLARENGIKVLLDGQGADEVFAGYPKYYQTYFSFLFKNKRKKFIEEVNSYNELHDTTLQFGLKFALMAYIPGIISSLGRFKRSGLKLGNHTQLNTEFYREHTDLRSPFPHFNNLSEDLAFSTTNYGLNKLLRFADKNSMAFSREIRLPFLSHELVEWAFSCQDSLKLRNGWTKYIIRESMRDQLPSEIAWRKDKMGYAPPQEEWMKNPGIRSQINEARSFMIKEGIANKNSKITDWQYLMAHQLFHFGKNKGS